jgi:hypothetical protein
MTQHVVAPGRDPAMVLRTKSAVACLIYFSNINDQALTGLPTVQDGGKFPCSMQGAPLQLNSVVPDLVHAPQWGSESTVGSISAHPSCHTYFQ